LQIERDWVVRPNAEGPAGLIDRKAPAPSPVRARPGSGAIGQIEPGAIRERLDDVSIFDARSDSEFSGGDLKTTT
jgi:hypothetical protein